MLAPGTDRPRHGCARDAGRHGRGLPSDRARESHRRPPGLARRSPTVDGNDASSCAARRSSAAACSSARRSCTPATSTDRSPVRRVTFMNQPMVHEAGLRARPPAVAIGAAVVRRAAATALSRTRARSRWTRIRGSATARRERSRAACSRCSRRSRPSARCTPEALGGRPRHPLPQPHARRGRWRPPPRHRAGDVDDAFVRVAITDLGDDDRLVSAGHADLSTLSFGAAAARRARGSGHGATQGNAHDAVDPGVHRRPAARRRAVPDPRRRALRAQRREPPGVARDRGPRPRHEAADRRALRPRDPRVRRPHRRRARAVRGVGGAPSAPSPRSTSRRRGARPWSSTRRTSRPRR